MMFLIAAVVVADDVVGIGRDVVVAVLLLLSQTYRQKKQTNGKDKP